MSADQARLLDLDAFVPRAIEVQWAGTTHRIPGQVLTADLVIGLQELGEKAADGDAAAVTDLIDLIDGVTVQGNPPLSVRDLPPTAIGPLAQFLVEGAGAGAAEVVEDPPPRPRRRGSSTTPNSKPPASPRRGR